MRLKVLSWNIWCDSYFDEVAKFLEAFDADIVGLQEVMADDPERDVITHMKGLGYHHVYAPKQIYIGDGRRMGPAVFSKYEIVESKVHTLSGVDSKYAVQVDVRAEEGTLHVFSTHLLHTHQKPSEVQAVQAKNLIKALPKERVIVMGDFNAEPDSVSIQKMRAALIDTDPSSQPTWSVYPEGCSTCSPQAIDTRLDYIFTTKDVKTSDFRVEESKGSDHLPISATIEF